MGNTMSYLFEAEYKDGTTFLQTPEDVSSTDPLRSCYYDVKQNELKMFSLVGKHRFSVSLEDGHFEVNGVPFFLHQGTQEELKDFRLIFYRKHIHSFNRSTDEELSHEVSYLIGWQTNDKDGKNVQHIMEIN